VLKLVLSDWCRLNGTAAVNPMREPVCLVAGFDTLPALVVPPYQKLPSSENQRGGFPRKFFAS